MPTKRFSTMSTLPMPLALPMLLRYWEQAQRVRFDRAVVEVLHPDRYPSSIRW